MAEVGESALVVLIPAADRVVAELRHHLDENATIGVPAHVTVLSPWLAPELIDDTVLAQLTQLFAAVDGFEVTFAETNWFGSNVLWLAPADDRPFLGLTDRLFAAFPDHPPFERRFDDIVPHLTVRSGRPLPDLQRAERDVRSRLPISAGITSVALLTRADGESAFSQRATFPLCAASDRRR